MFRPSLFSKAEIKQRLAEMDGLGEGIEADYNLACAIVAVALIRQTDKAGNQYMRHVNAVALYNPDFTMEERIIGTMHDLVEDTAKMPEEWRWTLDDLRDVGFSERIVAGIDAVTHREGELYFDFIVRSSQNPDALNVKLSDLGNNMSKSRNNYLPTKDDEERDKKYTLSYNYLTAVKDKTIAPGTPFGVWMTQAGPRLQDWYLLGKYSAVPAPTSLKQAFNPPPP